MACSIPVQYIDIYIQLVSALITCSWCNWCGDPLKHTHLQQRTSEYSTESQHIFLSKQHYHNDCIHTHIVVSYWWLIMVIYGGSTVCIPIASYIMFTFLDYTSLKGGYNQIYKKKTYSWLYNHMTYASLHISHIDLIHIHLFFLVVSESRLSGPKGRAARRSCRPPWTSWMAHCARWRTWSRSAWTAPWATRNARRPWHGEKAWGKDLGNATKINVIYI